MKVTIIILICISSVVISAESGFTETDRAEYELGYRDGINEAELLNSGFYFLAGVVSPFVEPLIICGLLFDIYTLFEKVKYPDKISGKTTKYQQGFRKAYSKQIRVKKLKSALQGNFIAGAAIGLFYFLIFSSLLIFLLKI